MASSTKPDTSMDSKGLTRPVRSKTSSTPRIVAGVWTGSSPMLDFQVEWHDATGVKDPVLATTWARLEIQLQVEELPRRWLTSCVRTRSNSVQRGAYGSVFPLAEWVVVNWWFLLHEPLRVPEYRGGRAMAFEDAPRQWAQRHDLLAAREGGALPDLTFYRDGPDVAACWFPDPEQDERIRPTRFISGVETVRLAASDLEIALGRFVESVLERLDRASDAGLRGRTPCTCRGASLLSGGGYLRRAN